MLSEVTSQWGSTCSRSGKARTRTMGLWECAEFFWSPLGLRVGVLPRLASRVRWRMCREARWLEKGDTGEVGGQEDFGYSWWREAAEERRGHCALLPRPWVSSLSATPLGTWRMAWWNRGVRIESLSSFSATFAQSLPRNLPGTHLTERLLEIIDWQEALTRREEKELDIHLFWKILSHHSNLPGWRLKCTWHVFYFLQLFWHLWVLTHMDWIYCAEELNWWFPMPWIVWIVDFGLLDTQHCFFLCLFLSLFTPFPSLANSLLPSPPSNLSFTQGQRHEESTGFPAEEEWIPRKQPSQQVRQIYEVSQVSGHFLAACPCGCVWDFFPGLATTADDLV